MKKDNLEVWTVRYAILQEVDNHTYEVKLPNKSWYPVIAADAVDAFQSAVAFWNEVELKKTKLQELGPLWRKVNAIHFQAMSENWTVDEYKKRMVHLLN